MRNRVTSERILRKQIQSQWDVLRKLMEENNLLKKKLQIEKDRRRREVVVKKGRVVNSISKIKRDIKKQGCCLCGYDGCVGAMDFHHIETKGESVAQIGTVADLIQEFTENKIVVLCATCHRELHHGAINPDFTGKDIRIEDFLKYETKRTDRRGNKRWIK